MQLRTISHALWVGACLAPWCAVAGQADSAHHDTPAAAMSSTPVVAGIAAAPLEARGYRIADTVTFGSPSDGVEYDYTHGPDKISVFITPYDKDLSHATVDDTTKLTSDDVDAVYNTFYAMNRQGQMQFLRENARREDDIRVAGHMYRGYVVWLYMRRRGATGPVYLYYQTYALPTGLVHIRAEMPWQTARNEEVTGFTGALLAGLVKGQ